MVCSRPSTSYRPFCARRALSATTVRSRSPAAKPDRNTMMQTVVLPQLLNSHTRASEANSGGAVARTPLLPGG